ncbi:Os09g0367633 [Oryza sativa Japonica Group]|uniref:Os09g0367633 protein n=2 Tax=Oryza sativa subsp. japonica TaxID=39947 RepID=Q69QE7_ORYSJ|nr:hypothetical protein [Oryza sativa Japonica Group]BAT07742.1 Os09g0367633 [Oryza sativa Japonica Group]
MGKRRDVVDRETVRRGWQRASRSGKAAVSTSPFSTSITSESSPARRQRHAAAYGRGAARSGSRERSGVPRPISRSPPPPPPPYGSRRSAAGFARPRRWSSRRWAQLAAEICGAMELEKGRREKREVLEPRKDWQSTVATTTAGHGRSEGVGGAAAAPEVEAEDVWCGV